MHNPIIFIITKLELGGAQKVCLSLYHAAKQTGGAYLITGPGGVLDLTVQNDPHVIMLPQLAREIGSKTMIKELKALYALYKTIREIKQRHKTVIVHTHSTKAGILGRWAAYAARVTHRIHTVHGFALHPYQRISAWSAIWLCEQITTFITTKIITVSDADMAEGSTLFWGFAQRAVLIRAAVENQRFIPAQSTEISAKPSRPFIIGTISCFKPQKNLIDLLKAFNHAYHSNQTIRLEIIGDGVERSQIEQFILDHNLIDVVTLHGWRHNIPELMKNWSCFALSSLWEGLPCAVIEARLMKLPVVAYKTGGIPEIIFNEKNGYLVNQKDWVTLSEKLITLSFDSARCAKLAHYPDDLTHFTADYMHKQHRELYESAV